MVQYNHDLLKTKLETPKATLIRNGKEEIIKNGDDSFGLLFA